MRLFQMRSPHNKNNKDVKRMPTIINIHIQKIKTLYIPGNGRFFIFQFEFSKVQRYL
jgi:hypothetical protein